MQLTGKEIKVAMGMTSSIIKDTDTLVLTHVNLLAVGCPAEIAGLRENVALSVPVVIAKNRSKLGFVEATQYAPKFVVAAGGYKRARQLQNASLRDWVWADKMYAAKYDVDSVSTSDMMSMLNDQLALKFYGGAKNKKPGMPYINIREVYPFDNQMIYSLDNYDVGSQAKMYKQGYTFDASKKSVSLLGQPIEVKQTYVTACGDSSDRMSTGGKIVYAPAQFPNAGISRGGKTSELMAPMLSNWSNILQALRGYQDAVRKGAYKPLVPMFAPVKLTDAGKVVTALAAAGVLQQDFIRWASLQEVS